MLCTNCYFKDNTKLSKLLNKGFKRPIYWNEYKIIFKNYSNECIRERLDASFQGKGLINYLFFLMEVVIILLMKIHIKIFSSKN